MDLALVFGDGRVPRTQSRLLFREEVFPVCSPRLLEKHGGDIAELLRAAPLLHLKPAYGQHWFDWSAIQARGVWPLVTVDKNPAFDNYAMVLGAAIAGQGVAIGWRHLVDELLDPSVLCRLPVDVLQSPWGYHLITPQHKRVSVSARCFVDWLLTELPLPGDATVDSGHG
jgi:DNA-binding transcriptional LysR family regulator